MSAEPVSVVPDESSRGYYGPDGQPQFFQDPAMDRFAGVVLRLAQELWVVSERLEAIERLADAKGVITRADLRGLEADPALAAERETALDAYLSRTLGALREP
jgi:hypothetical protein